MKDHIKIDKKGTHYILAGREVSEEVFRGVYPLPALGEGAPGTHHPAGWPMLSDGMAVHPDLIPEAVESAKRRGVPTEFEPLDGRPIFTSEEHKKRYCKAYGVHDNNCFNW